MQSIKAVVRARMDELGLSARAVAGQCKTVSARTMQRFVSDEESGNMSADKLEEIFEVLGLEIRDKR